MTGIKDGEIAHRFHKVGSGREHVIGVELDQVLNEGKLGQKKVQEPNFEHLFQSVTCNGTA